MLRLINLSMVALVCGATVGAALLLSQGVDSLQAQLAGHHGTIITTACDRAGKGWTCTGDFTSDDGTVRVHDVTFSPAVKQWPMAPVEAVISSQNASRAHTDGFWYFWFGSGFIFATLAAYMFREFFWDTENRRTKLARLAVGVAAIVVPVSAWTLLT